MVDSVHVEKQAIPLRLRTWHKLEDLLFTANDLISALSCIWLLLILGVTRFIHLQRSHFTTESDWWIEFMTSMGKSRIRGLRRPFWWRMSRFGVSGRDLWPRMRAVLNMGKAGEDKTFLLRDFLPSRCKLSEAKMFATTAMTDARFRRMSDAMFLSPYFGLSESEVRTITSYSGRRVLPTVAECMELTIPEHLRIGGWTDPSFKVEQKRMSMPTRYSELTLTNSAHVKTEAVQAARLSLKGYIAAHSSSTTCDQDPTWDALRTYVPARNISQKAIKDHIDSVVNCSLPAAPQRLLPVPRSSHPLTAVVAKSGPCAVGSSGKSSDSSNDDDLAGSASSTTASDSDDDRSETTKLEEDHECAQVEWLASKGAKGHLHLSGDSFHTTACQRCLNNPEIGCGMYTAEATGKPWSPRCFKKLPAAAQRLLSGT